MHNPFSLLGWLRAPILFRCFSSLKTNKSRVIGFFMLAASASAVVAAAGVAGSDAVSAAGTSGKVATANVARESVAATPTNSSLINIINMILLDDDDGDGDGGAGGGEGSGGSGGETGGGGSPGTGTPGNGGGVGSAELLPVMIAPPHLQNPDAGTLPGGLSVGSDGQAGYSIDLAVPPGTAGMQPALSLSYSSNGSNGMVGLGWSLGGLSTIHRCVKSMASDGVAGRISFDTADRLCLNGQRLLRADGAAPGADVAAQDAAYWAAGALYRTEIEDYSRITRLANGGFKVEEKNGRVRYFGTDANSAIAAQGRSDGQALLWAMSREEDRSGNYMTLGYSTDSSTGEYKPDLIRYGGNTNAGTVPDLAVRMVYAGRSDAQIQYMGGSRNDLRSLLKHVRTYINTAADGSGGTLVRDYEISHSNSNNSGRSLVNWVQVSAYNAAGVKEVLPRTDFGYGDGGTPKLVQKQRFDLNVLADGEEVAIKTYTADFYGTGVSSIFMPVQVCAGPGAACSYRVLNGVLAGRNGLGEEWGAPMLDMSQLSGKKYPDIVIGDLNGDGRDDIVLVEKQGTTRTWAYCLAQVPNRSSPVFAPCQSGGTLPGFRKNTEVGDMPSLIPLDNNGRSQLVYFDDANQAHACSYNGAVSCRTIPTIAPAGVMTNGFAAVQLGKGQADFFTINKSDSGTGLPYVSNVAVCRLATGTLRCDLVVRKATLSAASGAGDMNGDGLTDFFYGLSGEQDFRICLSTETGVSCPSFPSHGIAVPSIGSVGFGYYFAGINDLLGDGVNRYWGYTADYAHPNALCRLADGAEVCQQVDMSAIPAETKALLSVNETSSQAFFIDTTGIPASLNCTLYPTYVNSRYLQSCWITSLMMPPGQDLLKSVSNGVGNKAEVDYARADDDAVYSRYASLNGVQRLPVFPQQSSSPGTMVKQLRQANGRGDWNTRNYKYAGAMHDAEGRGSLGFTWMAVMDVDAGITNESFYSQEFPQVGMQTSTRRYSATCTMERTSNNIVHKTISMPNGASNYFPYVHDSTTSRADLNCGALDTVTTANQYNDNWGNLNVQVVTTEGGQRKFVQTSTTTYLTASGANYLAGLPTTVSVERKEGDTSTVRTSSYAYNSGTGLLDSETIEPGNSLLRLVTNHERSGNLFGQVNKVVQNWTNPACSEAGWPEAGCVTAAARTVSDTTYDEKGRFPLTVKNAEGHSITVAFDQANGTPTSRTDANGLTTTWRSDNFGRMRAEVRPDGNETRSYLKRCAVDCPFTTTATIQITEQFHGADRIAVPTVVYLDSAGHAERSKTWGFDGNPVVTDQRYDSRGRLTESDHPRFESAAAFLAIRQAYDELNRIIRLTTLDESGAEVTTLTSYNGLVIDQKNGKSQVRTETRDAIGQLRSVMDSNTPRGTTTFTYEPFGGLATTTDPNGNVNKVDYDNLGRRTGLHDPDLGYIEYKVDPIGQTYAQRSQLQRDAGTTTWISYDKLGRMTARYESDLESHWVFDTVAKGIGQLGEAFTGKPGSKDYRRLHNYDALGRPVLTTQYLSDGRYTAVNSFDNWGRMYGQTYQRGSDVAKVFSMRYNSYGYLSRIDRGASSLWQASKQDAANRVTLALLGNGLTQHRGFSMYSGRLENAELLTAGSVARLQENYIYDVLGNVTIRGQYWDAGGFQETFDYDTLNRLSTSQVVGKGLQNFTYDATGNLLTKTGTGTYKYPEQGAGSYQPHAVQTVTGVDGTFVYDRNGNLLSGAGRRITWTSFDMPLKIAKGAASAEFAYGPEHQRLRQVRVEGTTVYAGVQEVEPGAGGGVRVKTYWPNGIGVEIEESGVTQLYWTHLDRLGSVIAMTGQNGALLSESKQEYDPWGKRRSASDNDSTNDSIDGKIDNRGYTGHEMLDQVDLVHMNGRVYDPMIGKFLSGDPFVQDPKNGQSYNRYSYVLNNPTNLTDPTGFLSHAFGGGCDWENSCASTAGGGRDPLAHDDIEKPVDKAPQFGTAGARAEASLTGNSADTIGAKIGSAGSSSSNGGVVDGQITDDGRKVIVRGIAAQRLMSQDVLDLLDRWSPRDQALFLSKFGNKSESSRRRIQTVMRNQLGLKLTVKNFRLANQEELNKLGIPSAEAYVAYVDPTHTINVAERFFSMSERDVGVLIFHETTHFDDIGRARDRFSEYLGGATISGSMLMDEFIRSKIGKEWSIYHSYSIQRFGEEVAK